MAARNKPAGIRVVVYGIGKGKAGIEGLSVLDGTCLIFIATRYSVCMGLSLFTLSVEMYL
jgi:hypothetical protein